MIHRRILPSATVTSQKEGGRPRFIEMIRAVLLPLLVVLGTLAVAVPVRAHAGLVRSEPADNAILAEAPDEIRLWFSEPVSPEFSSARMLDINGQAIVLDGLRIAPDDPYLLIIDPPDLPPGVYSINWSVLSDADGHITQGLMVFGIGAGADLSAASIENAQVSLPLSEVFLRWVSFGLLAMVIGVVGVLSVVHPSEVSNAPSYLLQARRRIFRFGLLAAWLAFWMGFAWLVYQFLILMATVPDGAAPLKVAWQLLTRTRWGGLWAVRQVAWLLLIWRLRGQRSSGWTWVLVLVLVLFQALNGHAAGIAPGLPLVMAVAADVVHLLAVSFWLGGLAALCVGFLPGRGVSKENAAEQLRAGWAPFGRWAGLSVGFVVVTGLYSTGLQIASPDAMISTFYGRSLAVKVALMLGVGVIGLVNSMLLHPRLAAPLARLLHRPTGWTALPMSFLPRLIMLEAALGGIIFLVAGVLTTSPPARGPEFTPFTGERIDSMTEGVDDLMVNFSVKPNQPGQNVFNIRAVSQRRPPPADVLRLILRFTYLEEDLGTISVDAEPSGDGMYFVGGSYFSLAGRWQVEVVVRRNGLEDSVAHFVWTVLPAQSTRKTILSDQPWQPALNVAAAALLLIVIFFSLRLRKRSA
jgi:copper transport protein